MAEFSGDNSMRSVDPTLPAVAQLDSRAGEVRSLALLGRAFA